MERREQGIENLRSLVGDRYVDAFASDREAGAFGWYVAEHSIESCFSSIWSRPGLDWRSRCIATLSILTTLGELNALKTYVGIALRNGLTREEIEEVVIHTIPYLGYPRTGSAVRAIREALADAAAVPVDGK